ncbi:hypothetical protein FPV67DRAFT_1686834 [Lyophyllum atratum]|nr:hypothetical protein FPV67DRAFT_1686834 [Lyophyllum atratum]
MPNPTGPSDYDSWNLSYPDANNNEDPKAQQQQYRLNHQTDPWHSHHAHHAHPTLPLTPTSPHRTEWIYRHPKPRTPPLLTVSTSTSTINPKPSSPKHLSPKTHSPTNPSRLPIPVRARTRSTSARTSLITKQRPRPQTGYLAHAMSHANTSGNGSGSATAKKPAQVHSTIPARAGLGKSGCIKQKGKGKEKEKEEKVKEKQKMASPFWGLLRTRRGDEDRDDEEVEGSPGSRILDIVNSAASSSSVLSSRGGDDIQDEGDKKGQKKGQGKLKVKTDKGKGIALILGKGRPSIRPSVHKRSASLTSTQSTTSTTPSTADTITSTSIAIPAFSLPTIPDASQASSSPPRNRASSSSSNSSDSSASSAAHSTSTTATSPSPSVVASSPNSIPPIPAKSILTRSASTSSRAREERDVRGRADCTYPYMAEYPEHEYMYDQAQYGSGDEDDGGGNDRSSVGSGAGMSKNALSYNDGYSTSISTILLVHTYPRPNHH